MIDEDTVAKVAAFHGHTCPGLAMGIRAAEVALERIGPHSADEEVIAVVETDMCGVDAIQYLTGCTFGKGNLVYRDHGKVVFTFLRRSDRRAVRISMRQGAFGPDDDERERLRSRIRSPEATSQDRRRFWRLQRERAELVMAAPLGQLYQVREVVVDPPVLARIHSTVECASCAEPTMETRIRLLHGRTLCPPCFDQGIADPWSA